MIYSLILLVVAALGGWIGYGIWGHSLVRAMYEGRAPLAGMNLLIKRQAQHPLEYYLAQADAIVVQCVWLSGGVLLALGSYGWARRRWPAHPLCQPLWGVIWVATTVLWLIYAMQVPLPLLLPRWFWPLQVTLLPGAWLALPLAALGLWVGRSVLDQAHRVGRNLVWLILLGWAMNHGFAWMEGRGLEGMTHRLTDSPGHGRLARAAVEQESLWQVLTTYEAMVREGTLEASPHATRPPGQVLFIMLTERLASATDRLASEERLARLARLAALVYPLLAYLTLVPLVLLCRLYMDPQDAWLPAVFAPVLPNLVLMNLHLDQCLLPLLGMSVVYIWVLALRRGCIGWSIGAGMLWYMALFASFALLALAVVLGVQACAALAMGRDRRSIGLAVFSAALGFGLVYGLFYLGFGYDAWGRYQAAMAAHRAWKIEAWGVGNTLYYGGLNLVEFALWCGVPLVVLVAARVGKDLRAAWGRVWGGATWFGVALVATVCGLMVFGRTVGESGRLWLFLGPLVLACAAGGMGGMGRGALWTLWCLQFLTVFILKRFQDF